uniref:Uncharacterized protein n=2 Tax=Anguilla anguilla TaxID=7936 RepID=A0A0E9VBI9_ANGAN
MGSDGDTFPKLLYIQLIQGFKPSQMAVTLLHCQLNPIRRATVRLSCQILGDFIFSFLKEKAIVKTL